MPSTPIPRNTTIESDGDIDDMYAPRPANEAALYTLPRASTQPSDIYIPEDEREARRARRTPARAAAARPSLPRPNNDADIEDMYAPRPANEADLYTLPRASTQPPDIYIPEDEREAMLARVAKASTAARASFLMPRLPKDSSGPLLPDAIKARYEGSRALEAWKRLGTEHRAGGSRRKGVAVRRTKKVKENARGMVFVGDWLRIRIAEREKEP